jgi:putative NADH-flavin reductase
LDPSLFRDAGLADDQPEIWQRPPDQVCAMKVLVLGATGSVGQHIFRLGTDCGHELTALVRNPEKLKSWESRVHIVIGDALDKDAVEQAIRAQEAAIYAIGTKTIGRTTLFSESTGILIDAMERHRVKRLVCITGVGAGETKGHGGFLYDRILLPLITKRVYQDKDVQEAIIQKSSLDWVIVRPAMFREGTPSGKLEAVTDVRGVTLTRISRAEVAVFLLEQLADNRYLRKPVFIGHR